MTLLSKQLVRLGHAVTIIDRKYAPQESGIENLDGIEVIRLSVPWLSPFGLEKTSPILFWARTALNTILFTLSATRYLRRGFRDFDVLNTHVILSTFLFALLSRTWRDKLIYTHHAAFWPASTRGILSWLLCLLGGYSLKRIKLVIVLNDWVRDYFVARLNLLHSKVLVLPSGVDVDLFGTATSATSTGRGAFDEAGRRTVLFVGRINPMKGLEFLVRAADIIVDQSRHRHVEFLLVGPFESAETNSPGAYTTSLNNLIKALDLDNVVRLVGEVPFDDLTRIYSASYLFVLPSVAEQLPLAALEAMASGMPIVTTRMPWTDRWIKDGWNGMLVELGDEADLAEKIIHLLDAPDEAARIGANAKNFVRQFDWSNVAKSYAQAYLSASTVSSRVDGWS